uniref:Prepilin leader peptidase/N-methyltransferase n=1 Tax=Candidatus Kentrum sp. MB TaxID=2138164 RepID=A0A451BGL1_9GAMM|nr:MAG: type 4 prepilin peptidase 1 Aspartic peptidase. MEROPS family A24A [Candidatus Kentron sp. MB]VFK77408.1 MAG: type 4 prepilin peptidase 1 Aspartic peptidase. MEROPS family A24A [Candidatus Kentron sp. MB]
MSLIDYLRIHPSAFPLVSVLLGTIVGSFLNVVILRLPIMLEWGWRRQCLAFFREVYPQALVDVSENSRATKEAPFNLLLPRSQCPNCAHTLSVWENIPILSYLLLRGRCSACRSPISPRYPFIELLSGVMAGIVAWQAGFGIPAVGALVLTWVLIALAFIDWDRQQLPDEITLPTLWLGLAFNLFGVYASIEDGIIGAMLGYGVLWSVYWLFRLWTGKEGMGHGDFKLLGMVGAWLGWQSLPATILIASMMGALVGMGLILLRGHDRNIPIPFGPYLAIAAWITLLWGEEMMEWYWGILA